MSRSPKPEPEGEAQGSIVITAGEDTNLLRQHLVNQSVFLAYAPRPTPRQLVFERLRFADNREGFALDIPN